MRESIQLPLAVSLWLAAVIVHAAEPLRDGVTPSPVETWKAVAWSDLPGWSEDAVEQAWPAFLKSCSTKQVRALHPSWSEICKKAVAIDARSATAIRTFIETQFRPWALHDSVGEAKGLLTGYYEPIVFGEKNRTEKARFAVRPAPPDLLQVDLASVYPELAKLRLRGRIVGNRIVPYSTRAEITRPDWVGGAAESATGVEALAWLDDPVALFFLQVQGSGRIRFSDGDVLRVGYADANGHPYESIGKVLIQRGELLPEAASMQGIQAWARANPEKLEEVLGKNPSYIFFRALSARGEEGPPGALGVPLEAQRSIAVDPSVVPLGVPVYLAAEGSGPFSIRRLTLAQDTGAAIRGVSRADYYWGSGDTAGQSAGKTKQPLCMWVLLPQMMAAPR